MARIGNRVFRLQIVISGPTMIKKMINSTTPTTKIALFIITLHFVDLLQPLEFFEFFLDSSVLTADTYGCALLVDTPNMLFTI